MSYEVAVAQAARRPIAAVAITTTWREFPGQWRGMLDEVYACLRQAGVGSGCNVMHYRDFPGEGGAGGGPRPSGAVRSYLPILAGTGHLTGMSPGVYYAHKWWRPAVVDRVPASIEVPEEDLRRDFRAL